MFHLMHRTRPLILALAVVAAGCSQPSVTAPATPAMPESKPMPKLLTWPDLLKRARPKPTHTIQYGPGKTDVGDLWLPSGAGPHKTVLMIHGGCWQKSVADRTLMDWSADALAKQGFAVWNIEYRGVDEEGGGYPGTFQDVARAADQLRELRVQYSLDLAHVAAFGHSAGGHLAMWLAARPNLKASSALYTPNPLPIDAVLNSGGLADLKASAPVTAADCLSDIMDRLTGPPSAQRPDVFSDTSPARLLPVGVRMVSVNGANDGIAPPSLGEGWTALARRAGDTAETVIVPDSGHVELVAPGSSAFDAEVAVLKRLLGVG